MKIIFFGTSHFAARILASLLENNHSIVAVVTRPDRLTGRHQHLSTPPVKEMAIKLSPNIPLFQPEKASTPEFAEVLKAFEADLFIVVAYGEIIKKNLLEIPKAGCINIHASLLPKFRGAAPMQRCLMAGEKQTGITIIDMTPQMDAGDIIAMQALPVPDEMTLGELDEKLCALSIQMLFSVIQQFQAKAVVKTPQDHTLATLAPKLSAEEEKIDWSKTAQQIHNQIRALSPFPGAWCSITIGPDVKRLKIKKSQVVPSSQAAAPGTVLSLRKEGWTIACGQDALRLLEVQLEGKRAMSADECLRGIHQQVSVLTK